VSSIDSTKLGAERQWHIYVCIISQKPAAGKKISERNKLATSKRCQRHHQHQTAPASFDALPVELWFDSGKNIAKNVFPTY
jgi:hypothetical protein